MKYFFTVSCFFLLLLILPSACARNAEKKSETIKNINIAVLRGPSSIGMVKLMDEEDIGADAFGYSFEIFASPDEIVPGIVQGKIDIAAVPANLAPVLYNNTRGKVQVIVISTLGVMYIAENGESIASLEDLRGKTIFAGFKGKSPEYDLKYILSANGIDIEKDINIEWKSEHAESAAALAANKNSAAALPQPFAATAQTLNENIRIAIDLNKEWEKLQEKSNNPSALITGVLIARAEFIKQNPEAVSVFLDRYAISTEYANKNTDETAALTDKYNIFPYETAKKAIPYCNITFIEGREMMEKLSGYLNILYNENPQSVGGMMPDEEFYFLR